MQYKEEILKVLSSQVLNRDDLTQKDKYIEELLELPSLDY